MSMFNLLAVGDSNNSKTTLIRHFYDLYGIPFVDSQSDGVHPIILAEAPPSANKKELYGNTAFATPNNECY